MSINQLMQVFRSVRQAGMIFIAMTSSNGDFYASRCERVNREEIDDLSVKSITSHNSHLPHQEKIFYTLQLEEAIPQMEFNWSKSVNYVLIALGQRWEFIKDKSFLSFSL